MLYLMSYSGRCYAEPVSFHRGCRGIQEANRKSREATAPPELTPTDRSDIEYAFAEWVRGQTMKRIRIIHHTEYHYSQPVTFGPYRALMRPREGHDLRIVSAVVQIEPNARVRWLRDIEENSVAIIDFLEPAVSFAKLPLLGTRDS
jgi:hypothetical protein